MPKKKFELRSHYSSRKRWEPTYMFKYEKNAKRVAKMVEESGGKAKIGKNRDPIDFAIWPYVVYTKNHPKAFEVREAGRKLVIYK